MLRMLPILKKLILTKTLKTLTLKVSLTQKLKNHLKKISLKAKEKSHHPNLRLNLKENLKLNLIRHLLLSPKIKDKRVEVKENNQIFKSKWKLLIKSVRIKRQRKHLKNNKPLKNLFQCLKNQNKN